jgi:predicted secreted protein
MAPIRTVAASLWATLAAVIVLAALAIACGVGWFGLSIGGGIALFFVVWWLLLFAVLPFGARSQSDAGEVTPGTEPGAPALPALREKAIWTTLAASAVFLGIAAWLPLWGL